MGFSRILRIRLLHRRDWRPAGWTLAPRGDPAGTVVKSIGGGPPRLLARSLRCVYSCRRSGISPSLQAKTGGPFRSGGDHVAPMSTLSPVFASLRTLLRFSRIQFYWKPFTSSIVRRRSRIKGRSRGTILCGDESSRVCKVVEVGSSTRTNVNCLANQQKRRPS